MNRPQDRNLEQLLTVDLLRWTRTRGGWQTDDGGRVEQFRPLEDRDDALRIVKVMEGLGFVFEDRRVTDAAPEGAVLASFYRGSEVYSALAAGECQAICTAASRFVIHRAGANVKIDAAAHEADKVSEE
ncbi:MAG: hypothetical protein WD314_12435 [Trueperaceae bacterium]